MRVGTLLLVSFAAAWLPLARQAVAGVPAEQESSVTVLRGSSAPPPAPAPAPPQTVVVYRDVVYRPVYPYDLGYYVSPFIVPSFFARARHLAMRAPFAPTPVANGWPLLGSLAPARR